jgi:5-(carboxyamino)imidazole ribonucleotide synthase
MIGILGGGQLGRFLVNAAREWDIECAVLDPDPEAPAGKIAARFETGNLTDSSRVLDFARGLDLLTVEIENVSADALEELACVRDNQLQHPGAGQHRNRVLLSKAFVVKQT